MRVRWTFPSLWPAALGLSTLIVFTLHLLSPLQYTGTDARFSLFLSQTILDTGHFQLDSTVEQFQLDPSDYRLFQLNEHTYYNFPFGTSVFSLPFVWAVNRLGIRVTTTGLENTGLNLIAAVTTTAVFLLLVAIGRRFLTPWPASGLALIVMLGSSLTSSLATSLWNLNFTLLFYAFSLYLIVRFETGMDNSVHPLALGASLFAAFLCRPTAAVFTLVVLTYLLLRKPREFLRTAVTALVLLLGFSAILNHEMGVWLLPYYIPSRLEGVESPWWLVWYGLLFSPGRGLFVFSPIFLTPLLELPRQWHSWLKSPLFWLSVAWIIAHIAVVATFPSWWGGFSYGPRLLTDIVPAFYLLLLLWAKEANWPALTPPANIVSKLFLLFVPISLFINSYAGLFNPQTQNWNGSRTLPNVDRHPQILLDWQHPQFLATEAGNCERNQEFFDLILSQKLASLADFRPNTEITYEDAANGSSLTIPSPGIKPATIPSVSPDLPLKNYLPLVFKGAPLFTLMTGWYLPETDGVYALCDEAAVTLGKYNSDIVNGNNEWVLKAAANQPLTLSVSLNGNELGEFHVDETPDEYHFPFSTDILFTDRYNQLTLHSTDDGRLPGNFQFISGEWRVERK